MRTVTLFPSRPPSPPAVADATAGINSPIGVNRQSDLVQREMIDDQTPRAEMKRLDPFGALDVGGVGRRHRNRCRAKFAGTGKGPNVAAVVVVLPGQRAFCPRTLAVRKKSTAPLGCVGNSSVSSRNDIIEVKRSFTLFLQSPATGPPRDELMLSPFADRQPGRSM